MGEAQAPAGPAGSLHPLRPTGLRPGADVYQSIGVRPLINARGTFTIISGSTMLPEVRAAMDAAARQYVHLDELADAVGARLAALTGAEWGLVTNGCSAGLTLATAACVAGGNPDLHVRLPEPQRLPEGRSHHPDALAQRLRRGDPRGRRARHRGLDGGRARGGARPADRADLHPGRPARRRQPAQRARRSRRSPKAKGVPILVDAAAEILTIPNVHLQNGATLVAYSGGKCLRGPQTAGLLLGRKDLVRAAWVHSAPHHGITRSLKVGKEDAIGMLMAVEMWVKRDHEAEWKRWTGWLDHIAAARVDDRRRHDDRRAAERPVESHAVAAHSVGPAEAGTCGRRRRARAPRRRAADRDWPRRAVAPAQTGVSVTPYMMAAGDETDRRRPAARAPVEAGRRSPPRRRPRRRPPI